MFQYIKSVKKLFQNLHISNLCSIFAVEFKIHEDYEINKVEKACQIGSVRKIMLLY